MPDADPIADAPAPAVYADPPADPHWIDDHPLIAVPVELPKPPLSPIEHAIRALTLCGVAWGALLAQVVIAVVCKLALHPGYGDLPLRVATSLGFGTGLVLLPIAFLGSIFGATFAWTAIVSASDDDDPTQRVFGRVLGFVAMLAGTAQLALWFAPLAIGLGYL